MLPLGIQAGQRRVPWMTLTLLATNVLVYLWVALGSDFESAKVSWGFTPEYGCLATLFTHMFLHDDPLHLLLNMIFFVLPGMKLEDALGSLRYLGFYLIAGIAAAGLHVALAPDLPVPLVGASGAISGVLGAFMVLYPTCRMLIWLAVTFVLPAWAFLGFWFLSQLTQGYLIRSSGADSPVAVWAHVGGFAFGALAMLAFFGWARGPAMELVRGAPRMRRKRVIPRFERPVGLVLGWLLIATAAAYAASVYLDGGAIDPNRPKTARKVAEVVIKKLAGGQSVETLLEEAIRRGNGAPGYEEDREQLRDLLTLADDVVRSDAPGGSFASPAMTITVRRFFDEEFPKFPEKCRIGVKEVTALGVSYESGKSYTIICGTPLSPQGVFQAYLAELNGRGWIVERPIFDKKVQSGLIQSSDGEWVLGILIAPRRLTPTQPVLVIWTLERPEFDKPR